jgi:hypothetical protein
MFKCLTETEIETMLVYFSELEVLYKSQEPPWHLYQIICLKISISKTLNF